MDPETTPPIPDKLRQDILRLLKESVKSYRVRELREFIESYKGRPLCSHPRVVKKAYLVRYVNLLLEEIGKRWKGPLNLRYITTVLALDCRARNDFRKRYRVLNTSLDIQESPFYEVVHVLNKPTVINPPHVVIFKIPYSWSHLFIQEIQHQDRCTYEVQLFLEPAKEDDEWRDVHIRVSKGASNETILDCKKSGQIIYVTKFFRNPLDSFLGNRHQVDLDFPSRDQEDFAVQLSIRIVKRLSVAQLTNLYPVIQTCRLSEILEDFFTRAAYLACTVSLISSFEPAIMDKPCRGSGCGHPDVFDLVRFLREAQFRLRWVCPVCHLPLTYSSLEIDVFFQSFKELCGKINFTFRKHEFAFTRVTDRPICTIDLD